MKYDIIGDVKFPNTEIGKRAIFWYYRLFEKLISVFEYKGLPDSINRDYLEVVLHTHGSIIWIKDKQGKLRALRGAHIGIDCYNFPITCTVANHALGTLEGTFGVNAVWMRNNKLAKPTLALIKEFSMDLAELDVNLKINLNNLKTSKIFKVSNVEEGKQLKELYNKVISGEPAVVGLGGTDWTSLGDTEIFSADVQFYVDKFLAARRTVMNDFLTQLGINNVALEKKERLITDEVESNDQELAINKEYFLSTRREALEEVNKIFGTNITVDILKEEEEEEYDEEPEGERLPESV